MEVKIDLNLHTRDVIMRVNLPVTDNEYLLNDDTLILSTTDLKGRITYVNQTFLEVSGFSKEELLGKAHNIVRHPDMPPEAFDDLWKTLKAGKPWAGLVKNRRKNGDYYWVIGNATPLVEDGKPVGYLSVRTTPSRQLIEQTAPIYRQILEGKAPHLKIENGGVVRTDLMGKIASLFQTTLGKRIALILSLPISLLLIAAGAGWWGVTQSTVAPWLTNFIAMTSISGSLLLCASIYGITRTIQKPLNNAVDIANILASGDLDSNFATNQNKEFATLYNSLKQMRINLKATILEVRDSTISLLQAANELTSGNMDLSQRTEQQAASLEQTAASMEEFAATVKQNAQNAKHANQLASNASTIATRGNHMMDDVVKTMSKINESSTNISNITSVIDSIAFQTNILALNAAVEAARAGEQGRGFAVVATEVRSLAQRSATAAKEIKKLIEDSVSEIGNGTKLVDQVGNTMKEIVISINDVTNIMSEISTASQEQSDGIEQANQAISQMDEVTQQNAALVEEAAASTESLENQTKHVTNAITIFKVGKASHNAVATPQSSSHTKKPALTTVKTGMRRYG